MGSNKMEDLLAQLNASDIPGLLEENIEKKEEHAVLNSWARR